MSHPSGTWYLAPANDLTNDYSAGYDGNSFPTKDEAEAAIDGLGECLGGDTEWVAVQRRADVADYLAEIVAVGKRYGFSLSHEDCHGGFIVEDRSDRNEQWLLGAKADESLLRRK